MVQKYGPPVHEFSMSKAPLLTNLSERSRQFCEVGGVDFNFPRLQMFHINPCLVSQAH